MGIITRMMKQTAVYWAPSTIDEFGKFTWAEPVEIVCRWEDVAEEYIDAEGDRQLSSAKVYVGEDVEVGGVLFLGEITDIESGGDPKDNDGAWEIRKFAQLPNLKNTETLRTAFLGTSIVR